MSGHWKRSAGRTLPDAQLSVQAVVRPVAELYFPTAQLVQPDEPVAVW